MHDNKIRLFLILVVSHEYGHCRLSNFEFAILEMAMCFMNPLFSFEHSRIIYLPKKCL